jgi:hypothetical protein
MIYTFSIERQGEKMKSFKTTTVSNPVDKAKYIDSVWSILSEGYRNVEGGLLFENKVELIRNSSIWKLAIKKEKVIAVAIFKQKFGQKLVALSVDRGTNPLDSTEALAYIVRSSLGRAWMEVSEAAEIFVMKRCGGERFLIHHTEAAKLLKKTISPGIDGYHYERIIAGIPKQKIVLGTPSMVPQYV